MQDIIYRPEDAGDTFLNSKGKSTMIRKYHLTPEEMEKAKERWRNEVKDVSTEIKKKAGSFFFNPYRQGIYYYQIQTLFLLGSNEWHSLTAIVKKLEEYTSGISLRKSVVKEKGYHSAWDKFRGKSSRIFAASSKDYIGRIQENFVMLQRLSKMHPYGYKLHQVQAALDVKRESKRGFEQGIYYYRLSTYGSMAESLPIKDFSNFDFPSDGYKYINKRFIGTIVVKESQVVKNG